MKSGLEDRNNFGTGYQVRLLFDGLNEVRPRRPEQFCHNPRGWKSREHVSMKSGLEDRNNFAEILTRTTGREPVSMKSGLEDRNN